MTALSNISKIRLAIVETKDTSGFEYSYGPGGKYNTRSSAVAAARQNGLVEFKEAVGEASSQTSNQIVEFYTNPNSLKINYPTTIIKNQYIGMDGGVVRPTQIGFVEISGSGVMMASDNMTAIENFNLLRDVQARKTPIRIMDAGFGSIIVIIESLSMTIGTRPNVVDFDFNFIETKIVRVGTTGFELDRNRPKRNVAIEPIRTSPTPAKFSAKQVAKQSPANPVATETKTTKNADEMFNTFKGVTGTVIKDNKPQWLQSIIKFGKKYKLIQ